MGEEKGTRLLLTSAGWEENLKIRDEFLRLADKKPSEIAVFLVSVATEKDKDWKYVKYCIKELNRAGIKKRNIRIFSLNKKIDPPALKDVDIIYICGGNTFHYLHKIRETGFDKQIKKLVKQGVAYFGVSAGSIIAGPKIDIASIGGEVPGDENDINLKNLIGLKLTNVIIYPHYSKQDEYAVKQFEKQNRCKVLRLTDKQSLLIKSGIKKIIN